MNLLFWVEQREVLHVSFGVEQREVHEVWRYYQFGLLPGRLLGSARGECLVGIMFLSVAGVLIVQRETLSARNVNLRRIDRRARVTLHGWRFSIGHCASCRTRFFSG